MRFLVVLVIAAQLTGCNRSTGGGSALSPRECELRTERLRARLEPLPAMPTRITAIPDGFQPLQSPLGTPSDGGGTIVQLDRHGELRLYDKPVASVEALATAITAELPPDTPTLPLYLLADRRVPRATLDTLTVGLPAELELRMIVEGPLPLDPGEAAELLAAPSVQAAKAKIDGSDPAKRATAVADVVSKAIVPCEPLIQLFGEVSSRPDKAAHIATAAPNAITQCGCNLRDLDVLEYGLLGVLGAYEQPQRWLPVVEARELLSN